MRLVAGQGSRRNTRLDTLLSQTDNCLRQLATRLQASGTGDALLATHAARGSPSLACGAPGAAGSSGAGSPAAASPPGPGSAGGEGIAALEQSHEAWNRLAQAFQADVPHQPQLLTGGELREYQMKGLRWMVGLHQRSLNGILADEMGLGKTIQVIALVCHLAGELRERRPFLIAVPSSVLPNWEAELQRWAPSLKVICYRGDPDAREEVWRRQMRGGRGGQAGPGTHVVLTTYDFLMSKTDRPRLSRVHWSYICVDEGHRLKNAGCKLNAELRTYRAGHRLLLTGTPLQNSIGELWSLLNFLMPTLFDSGEDFEAWFGGADRRNASGASAGGASAGGDSSDDEEGAAARAEAAMLTEEEALIVTNRLHQVLRPFMLRRLKESVASELPQKREHLLPVLPSPYQQALFRLMQQELQRSAAGGGKGILKGVNNVLMEMRNVCNHPLISRLHAEGAETALLPHCLPPEVRLCGKLELLDRLLVKLRAGGHKVLLFCTMTRALDVISDHLDWRGFSHLRMDGATAAAERGELVSRFNDPAGGVLVFLLSIRAGGVGLNLQAADTVIMYDTDFNPQMDLQAQARAHRMGQKREVLVLRLKTVGTVEERIVAVASDKAQLADRSITGGFFDGKTSAEERQRYLLDTIRSSQRAAAPLAGSGDGGDGGGALSDAQLNALLARGEGELELFEAEDRRMRETELASWQAMQRGTTAGSSGGAAAAGRAAQLGYSRLAGEDEVAPLVAQAAELLQPKRDEDEGRELGRGKRQRGAAAYRDLPEREFNRLCRDGVEAGQVPVPLLAGCRNGSREAEKAGGTEVGDLQAAGKRHRMTRHAAAAVAAAAGPEAAAAAPAAAPSEQEAASWALNGPVTTAGRSRRVTRGAAAQQGEQPAAPAAADKPEQQAAATAAAEATAAAAIAEKEAPTGAEAAPAEGAALSEQQPSSAEGAAAAAEPALPAVVLAEAAPAPAAAEQAQPAAGGAASARRRRGRPRKEQPVVAAPAPAVQAPAAAAAPASTPGEERVTRRKQGRVRKQQAEAAAAAVQREAAAAGAQAGLLALQEQGGAAQGDSPPTRKRGRPRRQQPAAEQSSAAAAAALADAEAATAPAAEEPGSKRLRGRLRRGKENQAAGSGMQ